MIDIMATDIIVNPNFVQFETNLKVECILLVNKFL